MFRWTFSLLSFNPLFPERKISPKSISRFGLLFQSKWIFIFSICFEVLFTVCCCFVDLVEGYLAVLDSVSDCDLLYFDLITFLKFVYVTANSIPFFTLDFSLCCLRCRLRPHRPTGSESVMKWITRSMKLFYQLCPIVFSREFFLFFYFFYFFYDCCSYAPSPVFTSEWEYVPQGKIQGAVRQNLWSTYPYEAPTRHSGGVSPRRIRVGYRYS